MAKSGRPTKYKPEYCVDLLAFFDEEVKHGNLPLLSKWSRVRAGVCADTAIEWTNKFPDFSEAYKKAKDIQKETVIDGGLKGRFNPTFAIFTAKNITDMRDKVEHEHEINLPTIIIDV